MNKSKSALRGFWIAFLGFLSISVASAQDAAALVTEMTDGINSSTTHLWTIGGAVAAVAAVGVVIFLLIRNGKGLGRSA